MSPILDLQRSLRELGRIRTGQQVPAGKGKRRPAKLETFRLTSPARDLLEHAAQVYGGQVKSWGEQWELIVAADALDVLVPPGNALSQWYELWSGGGCQRRCDGERETLTDEPCKCPAEPAERRRLAAEGEACKPTTRLNVMLPRIPDLGVWRLEVHGYYAARELAATAELCAVATASGRPLAAQLVLEPRARKRPGQPPHQFGVPVLRLPGTTLGEMLSTVAAPARERPALPAERPALPTETAWHGRPAIAQGPPPPAPTEAAPRPAVEPEEAGAGSRVGPEPLSREEFLDRLKAAGVGVIEEAVARAHELYPGRRTTSLSDEERGLLWASLSESDELPEMADADA